MKVDLLVKGGDIVVPGQGCSHMDVAIGQEKVLALLRPGHGIKALRVLDAKGKLVIPGGVDAHTHLTMGPGESGYETETRSAAIGGITTTLSYILDAGDHAGSMRREIAAGERRACGDFGLHPSVVTVSQIDALGSTVDEFGTPSFKFFMTFRGEEGSYLGIPGNDDGFLFELLRRVAGKRGVIPCVHAENIEIIWKLKQEIIASGDESLRSWDRARPDYVEAEATMRALYLAEKAGSPLYIVHITCREALEMVRKAKAKRPGMVYGETCVHYLTMSCENGPSPTGKVNPPLRHPDDLDALWEGVADGTIDVVGSDHVPRRLHTKEGGIWKASAGFPGVGSLLPVFLTEGIKRGLTLELLVPKLTSAPASIFGLAPFKGFLVPGADGDLVILDPEKETVLSTSVLESDADYTPYEGWIVNYMPQFTVLRGHVVVEEGRYVGKPGIGSYLRRSR